ncbi:DUF4352 domain-containing protein [Lapidilactobacillus mulanensis]|uniref:DUF4352 domain-containing protein n=1 Tax=Lapidilactobacillus mulanensis TaxID=2485999 RepID=A0ABW4DPF8_9LACO|nr:DUF4352 domain-containing protein [Lapidilactobacillus mulanensis]
MAKKQITGDDGKTYTVKEKKPFYKRVWFWILVVIVVAIVGSQMGGNDDSDAKDSSEKTTETKKSSSSKKSEAELKDSYKVGETATYKGYSFKVNSVKFWDGDDMDTPDSGKQYVIVNVTITNKSAEKQDYNPYDFKLNADGNSTDLNEILINEEYNKDTLNSGTLDKDATVTGNMVGQAKKDAKLKLQYQTSFWNDKTVDVTLN